MFVSQDRQSGFTPHLFSFAKKGEGFTLIETVIYIALLAIMIGGGIVGVYNILEGSGRTRGAMYREQDAYFITRKIDTVLAEANPITVEIFDNALSFDTLAGDAIQISLEGDQIFLRRNGFKDALHDIFMHATDVDFIYSEEDNTLTASFTLAEHEYSVSHYLP